MKIKCSTCGKVYDIPDERLPDKPKFSFPCPACKGMISVEIAVGGKTQAGSTEKPAAAEELPKGDALKKQILRKVTALPPMPQTVLQARNIMSSDRSSFTELAKVLETDQAIVSRLLKLANSSYYGMRGKISSIQHASVVLGFKTLKDIISMAGSSKILGGKLEGYGLSSGDLWQHSLAVAFGAKFIAAKKSPDVAEDAFVAGLIHDCGKLVLDEPILERKALFQNLMAEGNRSFLEAEKELLGFDHSEIASALCKSWNVPDTLTTAIRYHHLPARAKGSRLTLIIHVADGLAMMSGLGAGIDGMSYMMDPQAMATLDIGEEEVPELMGEMVDSVMQIINSSL